MMASQRAFGVEASEYEIKATFLYNFAKFTNWPPDKLAAHDSFSICVIGKDPFQGSLKQLAKGKVIKDHELQIRSLSSFEDVKSCHVLFIAQSENKNISEILKKIQSSRILSVAESTDFLQQGGHIQFFVKEDKVGFEVNLPALEREGLKIDARVLNIAKVRR